MTGCEKVCAKYIYVSRHTTTPTSTLSRLSKSTPFKSKPFQSYLQSSPTPGYMCLVYSVQMIPLTSKLTADKSKLSNLDIYHFQFFAKIKRTHRFDGLQSGSVLFKIFWIHLKMVLMQSRMSRRNFKPVRMKLWQVTQLLRF